jgi:hypothetical protein
MLGGKDCLEDAAFMDSDDLDSMLDDDENEEEGTWIRRGQKVKQHYALQ